MNAPLIVGDVKKVLRAAVDGIGLAFVSEALVAQQLTGGAIIRVLEDWCQPFPGRATTGGRQGPDSVGFEPILGRIERSNCQVQGSKRLAQQS